MKTRILLIKFYLLSNLILCCSPKQNTTPKDHNNKFSEKFNSRFNDTKLFIACVAMKKLSGYDSSKVFLETAPFIEIATEIQQRKTPLNLDSLVKDYTQSNKHINFYADSMLFALSLFVECNDLIDLIFSDINDDDEKEMKAFEEKAMKIEDVKRIYLLYMKYRPDLSSLSSAEGVALNIQLTYYLYLQTDKQRKEIIKNML